MTKLSVYEDLRTAQVDTFIDYVLQSDRNIHCSLRYVLRSVDFQSITNHFFFKYIFFLCV